MCSGPNNWGTVFFVIYCVYLTGAVVFAWFASGETQAFDRK